MPSYDITRLDMQLQAANLVNVKVLGAVGDGVADDTAAFQAAADSLVYGGELVIPVGYYRLTDEITIKAGTTVSGQGSADFTDGDPPSVTHPSFVFQDTPGKAVFVVGVGSHNVRFENLSLSPALVPTHTPVADGRYGIKLQGSYPGFIWGITFSRVTFYNFERAISIHDPNAGNLVTPDWAVNPIGIVDCRFQYPGIGLYLNTNNADAVHIVRSIFFVASGGTGIYLRRFGFMHFDTVFGGGVGLAGTTRAVYIEAAGTNAVEKLLFTNCQWESLTHFLYLAAGGTYYPTNPLIIDVHHGIAEMGSDVYLGNAVHFISRNNRWSVALNVDSANVKVSSYDDHYQGTGRWYVLTGDERDVWWNLRRGPMTAAAPALFASSDFDDGRMTQYATAAPVAGQFYVGDRVVNSAPTVGQPKAWTCTATGTPGTWVSEGNL